ncbi:short chain dehydrogenase/reductase [Tothia fuscella]|uniref:Short-chain dehydrogenase/reductase 3 n=1 Tax=Tothia fuscella TaxID=1048955 RepID=A0A9P4NLV6_9PEZI|nr:short chain dehydrogenase/reductase [Tothia fuscella]
MPTQTQPPRQTIHIPKLPSQKPSPPWHTHLTIDLLSTVLRRSLFHPGFAWMIPLSLRAVTVPYEFLSMRLSIAYASLLTLLYILSYFNERVAFGTAREMDWEEEVVVITGGAGGLGALVAGFYGRRGVRVAVLDVKGVDEGEEEDDGDVKYYRCDVGDAEQVEACARQIREDLGIPTILINNAAIINAKSILNLRPEEVEKTFRVNLLSHFHTIQTFLPGMLEEQRGTIVTVASVLGHIGCANLADYTASKAGLLAMHASLRAELHNSQHPGAPNIKTVLVSPGQLDTPLFAGMQTPSNFLAPVVQPVELAKEIVRMVDSGSSGEVMMPLYARWIPLHGVLPVGVQKVIRGWSRADEAMLSLTRKKGL